MDEACSSRMATGLPWPGYQSPQAGFAPAARSGFPLQNDCSDLVVVALADCAFLEGFL